MSEYGDCRYGSNYESGYRFSLTFALILGVFLTGICYLFTNQIAGAFLTEPAAFDYAVQFSRILLTTGFLFGIFSYSRTHYRL